MQTEIMYSKNVEPLQKLFFPLFPSKEDEDETNEEKSWKKNLGKIFEGSELPLVGDASYVAYARAKSVSCHWLEDRKKVGRRPINSQRFLEKKRNVKDEKKTVFSEALHFFFFCWCCHLLTAFLTVLSRGNKKGDNLASCLIHEGDAI